MDPPFLPRFSMMLGLLVSLTGCVTLSNSSPAPAPSQVAQVAQPNAVITLGRLEPAGEVIRLSVPNAQWIRFWCERAIAFKPIK